MKIISKSVNPQKIAEEELHLPDSWVHLLSLQSNEFVILYPSKSKDPKPFRELNPENGREKPYLIINNHKSPFKELDRNAQFQTHNPNINDNLLNLNGVDDASQQMKRSQIKHQRFYSHVERNENKNIVIDFKREEKASVHKEERKAFGIVNVEKQSQRRKTMKCVFCLFHVLTYSILL